MKINESIEKNFSQYIIFNQNEPEGFIEHIFPVHIIVFRQIAKYLLPDFLFYQFVRWQNNMLYERIFSYISSSIDKKIKVFCRPVTNFAPKYSEFKIFLDEAQNTEIFFSEVYGFGQSFFSTKESLDKAIGEFLERYFLGLDWNKDVLMADVHTLGNKAVPLVGLPLYTSWQQEKVCKNFITQKNTNDAYMGWVKAKSLLNFGSKYIPAQRVFWMRKKIQNELILNHPTSNGNAGFFTPKRAILSGLYELVERDSFMFFWLLQVSPEIISNESINSPGVKLFFQSSHRYSLKVFFYNITTAIGIPTVMCVIYDQSNEINPKISFGASSGFNLEKNFDSSLMEALVVQRHHLFVKQKKVYTDTNMRNGFFGDLNFDKTGLSDRITLWSGVDMLNKLDFLEQGSTITFQKFSERYEKNVFRTEKQELFFIKKLFASLVKKHGVSYNPYIYRAQNSLLKKLNYSVINVSILGLYPLYLSEHQANLDISKIAHWKETLEISGYKWDGYVKNFMPHPFP